jgi:serine/threonine protein kinase
MGKFPGIPGYRITEKLGEGGMATVYLGIQEKLSRNVAIKILEPSLLKNTAIATRFLIEAETAANLNHTNIISIFDIGHKDDNQYIVMEHLKETLKDYLFGFPDFRIKPEEALKILSPISDALDHAHSKSIIHRDIKTENIMFRQDGTPVLTDFGIARALDSDSNMTRTGISLGTPYYMSPEQCQADKLDGRSDFYSLGVVLFEIITGGKPYEADNPTAVALKHIQDPIPLLPDELNKYQILIDKMMAKKREDRIANGAELRKLIDSVLAGEVEHSIFETVDVNESDEMDLAFDSLLESDKPQQLMDSGTGVIEGVQPTSPTDLNPPGTPPEPTQTGVWDSNEKDNDDDFMEMTFIETEAVQKPQTTEMTGAKKKYSRKFVIEVAVLVVLLGIIFYIFYNLGMGSGSDTPQASTNNPGDLNVSAQAKTTVPAKLTEAQFQDTFNKAKEYIDVGDYINAKAAIDTLKKNKDIPELKELEEQLSGEMAFNTFLKSAEDYFTEKKYAKAQENLIRAETLKITPRLEELKEKLAKVYKIPKKTYKRRIPKASLLKEEDDKAYRSASLKDTIAAYRHYIGQHPSGRHIDEAMNRISKIKEDEHLRALAAKKEAIQITQLRRTYKTLNYATAETMIRQHNFFDNGFNKEGHFKNHYEKKEFNGNSVVIDQATGLMWYDGGSSKKENFRKAGRWVRYLNRNNYGGFSDWRIPTLEEATSLLEKRTTGQGLHISPAFRTRPNSVWTGDSLRLQTRWMIRFNSGTIFADSDRSKHNVLPVRSIE